MTREKKAEPAGIFANPDRYGEGTMCSLHYLGDLDAAHRGIVNTAAVKFEQIIQQLNYFLCKCLIFCA